MSYLYQLPTPEYNSNEEYRSSLRTVFHMNYETYMKNIKNLQEQVEEKFDKETLDELEFDEEAVQGAMDFVYDRTKNNELFINIYKLAAAKMISTDVEIGMSICFSYDYFRYFHTCLSLYLENASNFDENSNAYKYMVKILS